MASYLCEVFWWQRIEMQPLYLVEKHEILNENECLHSDAKVECSGKQHSWNTAFGTSWFENIHLCILSATISMDDDSTWTYVCLFLFLSVVSQNSIITLMKKLFSSSWMKLNSSFFLSFYRWTLMALGRQGDWKLNENSGKIQQKQASMIKKDRKNCKTFPNNFYLLDRTTNRLNWHLSHCEHFVSYVSVTFILIFEVVSCIFNFFLFLHICNKI